ncbi:hypothetical protein AFA91_09985 [Mycolicibacterium goodii]|uniref:Uncharacterized protein n=2 Tax=Mycolicibacterium goodii TaxID=134601 RepID=A0A0K0X495_MYCGD|nr:hypothetical protein AFA91_09985 [Mycolicibacterium goodii]
MSFYDTSGVLPMPLDPVKRSHENPLAKACQSISIADAISPSRHETDGDGASAGAWPTTALQRLFMRQ